MPGSGLERLGVEEWPCVDRASSGYDGSGLLDGPAVIAPLCGADGSLRGSGSAGGSGAEVAPEEPPDVLIGSGESTSFLFLLATAGHCVGFGG